MKVNKVTRQEDNNNWYLELQKDKQWFTITVNKDQDSAEFWNSIQFNTNGSKSPRTYNALVHLFRHWEKISDEIRNIENKTATQILELFREKNRDIIISTKPNSVKIKFKDISAKTKKSLEDLYEAILFENTSNPIS